MKECLLFLFVLFLGIHGAVAADEPIQEPDIGPINITDLDIAEGALDGIMDRNDPTFKMGNILASVYNAHLGKASTSPLMSVPESIIHEDGTVSIDAVGSGTGPRLKAMIRELELIGFNASATYRHVVSGTIPIESLGDMCSCSSLKLAMPALTTTEAGSVTSEGVVAMGVDKVLENLGVDGSGVTVGVISDSYDALSGAAVDIATGDLPPADRINILSDPITSGSDEGRAMMQLIHDVAPGSNLTFHTGFGGQATFANVIRRLAIEAGCQVIVDDLFNSFEPAFQDGIIAQAVDTVRNRYNVSYFSSAGNYGRNSYEYPFIDSGIDFTDPTTNITYRFHDFAYASRSPLVTDPFQTLYLPNERLVTVVLTWDEPFASASPQSSGSTSDLALFFIDPTRGVIGIFDDSNIGGDPIEVARLNVTRYLLAIGRGSDPGFNFQIAVGISNGKFPGRIKVTPSSGLAGFVDYATNSGSGYGHSQAAGSAAVAAAFAQATPGYGVEPAIVEPESSAGGVPILFDKLGNRLPEPIIRRQPRFTGPDGTRNTFFGAFSQGSYYFFGTSAAAPHAAAVAALLLEADPELSPREVHTIIQRTAMDMQDPSIPGDDKGFDFRTGYGFINASAAVNEALNGSSGGNRNLRANSENIIVK